jgi:hypothetical protein
MLTEKDILGREVDVANVIITCPMTKIRTANNLKFFCHSFKS